MELPACNFLFTWQRKSLLLEENQSKWVQIDAKIFSVTCKPGVPRMMRAGHLRMLVLQNVFLPYIYLHTYTHTPASTVQQSIHSSTFCILVLPYVQSRWQHRKECITIPPTVRRVPDSRPTTGTACNNNSEFRPNKQLSKIEVSYCNSKALFYNDHYLRGNSLGQY